MTKYSVKKPFTVLVGVVLAIVLGVVSFLELNTDLLPAMDLPYVVVYTVYPGASPERVETAVTQPLEQAVATTSGLENISSISSENLSLIIMEFSGSTNMDSAMIELSSNIDMVSGYLDDMVQSPTLMKINPDMLPVQMLAIDVDGMDVKQLSEYVQSDLAPRLERIDGVATVDVSGIVEDRVEIRLNQEKNDKINDDILKSVNKTLYKPKKDLDKAKQELTDKENELNNLKNSLANASAELDAGQIQAQSLNSEKTSLEAQKKLLEGAQQALDGLKMLNSTLPMVDNTIMGLQFMAIPGFDENTALKDLLAFTLPEETPPEIAAGIQPQIDGIKMLVNGLVASGAVKEDDTLAGVSAMMKEQIKVIREQLVAMNIDQAVIDAADSTLLNGDIAVIDKELTRVNFLVKQMEATLRELKKTYATLEAGKIDLAAGSAMLMSGKAELDNGIKQFEDARDAALKQANIDALVSQETLSAILMAQNFSMPAGYISNGEERLTVKVGETFQSLEELDNLLLVDMNIDGVDPIYLKDVADVSIKDNSQDSYVRVNGNPSVTISIQKASTASTSRVSELVNKEAAEIMEEQPGVHITQLMDQGIYIDMVVSSVMNNMVYGGIIALIVLIFFLKDVKPTLIIGFAIPLSVLFAIVLMYFSGVNLNVMSLSGLALAVGMLVDNSIVVIENIYRLRNLGYSRVKAAVIGAKQVAGAIASSTLTTICVFLPIVFTDGLARQLFVDMGLTIAYSLVASLVVALTVVPAMASAMLKNTKDAKESLFDKLTKLYEKGLGWNIDHGWLVILLATGLMAFAGWQVTKMPLGLIPAMDSTQMQMTLTVDREVPDEELIAQAETIAKRTMEIDDVVTVGTSMGGGGLGALMGGGGSEDTKSMSFYVVLSEDKKLSNREVADLIETANPEFKETLSVTESTMDLGALAGSGISVQIKGNDLDKLQAEGKRMSALLEGVEGIAKVSDGSQTALEEVRIDVKKDAAMKHNLTVAQVFQKVSGALTENTTATTLNFDGTDMDGIIYASSTHTTENIGDLVVATATDDDGEEYDVLLSDIAVIGSAYSPDSINRSNQSRYITVSATIAEGYNASLVARDVEKLLENHEMPKGYSYEMTGEDESVKSAMFDMIKMIGLAIVFIYLIMVAQFQSLK